MHLHKTVWWSWGDINAFTLQNFKCIKNFIRLMFYIFFKHTNKCWKNAMILLNMTKWRKVSVLMSESFIDSFNRFIQTADSFRNEASGCPYEWATESLTHSIRSRPWIHSVMKHRCVLLGDTQQFCCGFDLNYFHQRNWAKTVNILSKI